MFNFNDSLLDHRQISFDRLPASNRNFMSERSHVGFSRSDPRYTINRSSRVR